LGTALSEQVCSCILQAPYEFTFYDSDFRNVALLLSILVLQLRGGKSKASARRKSVSTSSKKRAVVKDDEDDDDNDNDYDDEEEEDSRSSRRKSSRKSVKGARGRKGGRSSSLVQYGKGSKSKAAGLLAGLVSQSREKLEELTKQSQSAYKDVYRRAKVTTARGTTH
jgi:hypothetical protein